MVGGFDRQDVELMTLHSLFDRLASVRRVEKARELTAFHSALAARSDERGQRDHGRQLFLAAGGRDEGLDGLELVFGGRK
jgi:hypothetical protein